VASRVIGLANDLSGFVWRACKTRKGLGGSNPPSPPPSLAAAAISGEQREMAAFVARFERSNRTREGRIVMSFDAVRVFLSARAQVVRFRNCFG